MFATLKSAKETVSVTNRNSKMPGSAFSSSAKHCRGRGRLANIKGSICEGCYALRIQNMRPSVNKGWTANYEKSLDLIANAPAKWIAACVFQILRFAKKTGEPYHRWFDAGDLDSVDQLAAICEVARQTPHINHWLPTRELAIVRAYKGAVPSNLVIRLSAPMVDQAPSKVLTLAQSISSNPLTVTFAQRLAMAALVVLVQRLAALAGRMMFQTYPIRNTKEVLQ